MSAHTPTEIAATDPKEIALREMLEFLEVKKLTQTPELQTEFIQLAAEFNGRLGIHRRNRELAA